MRLGLCQVGAACIGKTCSSHRMVLFLCHQLLQKIRTIRYDNRTIRVTTIAGRIKLQQLATGGQRQASFTGPVVNEVQEAGIVVAGRRQ